MTDAEKVNAILLWTHSFKIISYNGYAGSKYYFAEYSHYPDTFGDPVILSTGDHRSASHTIDCVYEHVISLVISMCRIHQ